MQKASAKKVPTVVVKLTLRDVKSVRQLVLPASLGLRDFAGIIECAFGFDGGHLSCFARKEVSGRTVRSTASEEVDMDVMGDDGGDSRMWQMTLGEFLPERSARAFFEYDFGDSWDFDILRMLDKPGVAPYTCIKSVGMDGIEDCGGAGGLLDLAEGLKAWQAGDRSPCEAIEWVFGDDKPTPEGIARILFAPTADEITQRLK